MYPITSCIFGANKFCESFLGQPNLEGLFAFHQSITSVTSGHETQRRQLQIKSFGVSQLAPIALLAC
jgi:hypothetical protein